jgi:hypothetical protein
MPKPKKHQWCVDLQSFTVEAYTKEEAQAKAVQMLANGEETVHIDQVIDEGEG